MQERERICKDKVEREKEVKGNVREGEKENRVKSKARCGLEGIR